MRYLFYPFLMIVISTKTQSQTLLAIYDVSNSIEIPLADGKIKSEILTYTGMLYRKGSRYIYFERPLYLAKFPTGKIFNQLGDNDIAVYGLNTDTLQSIVYADYDSLLERRRFQSIKIPGMLNNVVYHFDAGVLEGKWRAYWQIGKETKVINGLTCRKAVFPNQWEVWFCPDIPIQFGPSLITALSGLVVEANNLQSKEFIMLKNYVTNVKIPDAIFWPAVFNEPFEKLPDVKNTIAPDNNPKSDKDRKKAQIMDQQ